MLDLVPLLATIVGLIGGILSSRVGVMGHLWGRIRDLEKDRDVLFERREADALVKRAQGDHIDVLEAHIWARKDPPPPPRPAGV